VLFGKCCSASVVLKEVGISGPASALQRRPSILVWEDAMKTTRCALPFTRLLLVLLAPLLALALTGRPVAGREVSRKQTKIDPQADQVLHQMSDYLKGLNSFKVQAHTVEEVPLASGQKIDVLRDTEASVLRPNHLQSRQVGPGGMAFNYDGNTMTLYCQSTNTYATAPAPNNLEAAVAEARTKLKIEAPGGNLVASNPYEMLMKGVTSGRYIGKESVNGMTAHHLAFTGKDADWQIWIQDGAQPLPLRYKVTDRTAKSRPEAAVTLTNWQPQANLSDGDFKFQPPSGASKVEEFPTECGSTAASR
jgi:hypothetical protein